MKKILLKIANLLYINIQYMDNYGLLNGKMGAALFFYEYSRYTNNEIYNNFADYILDDIFEAIANEKVNSSTNLSDGLGGIGWGLQYLINHNFIDGDPDEVLEDFDKKVQERIDNLGQINVADYSNYIAENDYMLGVDSYIYLRAKDFVYNIDNLQKITDFYFKILRTDKIYPMQFLNTCYSFLILNYSKMKGEYTLLLRNKLKEAYQKPLEKKLYTNSDIRILQRFNENREGLFALDFLPVSAKQDEWVYDDVDAYLKCAAMELLSFDSKYHLFEEEIISKYLDEGMKDMPSCNLSLEKGIAGLGLSILKALQS